MGFVITAFKEFRRISGAVPSEQRFLCGSRNTLWAFSEISLRWLITPAYRLQLTLTWWGNEMPIWNRLYLLALLITGRGVSSLGFFLSPVLMFLAYSPDHRRRSPVANLDHPHWVNRVATILSIIYRGGYPPFELESLWRFRLSRFALSLLCTPMLVVPESDNLGGYPISFAIEDWGVGVGSSFSRLPNSSFGWISPIR